MVEIDLKAHEKQGVRPQALPGHVGHRRRLKEKYISVGADALQDYELLELLLTYSIPHRDTKPYAKQLLAAFQNIRAVLEADLESLQKLGGLPLQSAVQSRPLETWSAYPQNKNSNGGGSSPARNRSLLF
jgi:DNA repair protein RadC